MRRGRRESARRGDELVSVAELAAYLGVPVATVYRWRHQRRGPLGYRIGRHVRYRTSDIERWLETQRDSES
jgi:excisionase family DNA binding protein